MVLMSRKTWGGIFQASRKVFENTKWCLGDGGTLGIPVKVKSTSNIQVSNSTSVMPRIVELYFILKCVRVAYRFRIRMLASPCTEVPEFQSSLGLKLGRELMLILDMAKGGGIAVAAGPSNLRYDMRSHEPESDL
jgi:hypothetical protein